MLQDCGKLDQRKHRSPPSLQLFPCIVPPFPKAGGRLGYSVAEVLGKMNHYLALQQLTSCSRYVAARVELLFHGILLHHDRHESLGSRFDNPYSLGLLIATRSGLSSRLYSSVPASGLFLHHLVTKGR